MVEQHQDKSNEISHLSSVEWMQSINPDVNGRARVSAEARERAAQVRKSFNSASQH